MEDKTFLPESADGPLIAGLDQIKDPIARKEFEEMEATLKEIEYFNRRAEAELRQAGLI